MEGDLTIFNFTRIIKEQMNESDRYEQLKDQERVLTQEIQETTAAYKKLQNDFSREQDENTKEMTELKRQKNEAQVEKDLHIQYLERQIQGKQSCEDRLHKKQETELQKQIDQLRNISTTEAEVNDAVRSHLNQRVALLQGKYKEQESKREAEVQRIENERNEIKEKKTKASEEIAEIMEKIKADTAERKQREEKAAIEEEQKQAKIKEKMAMDDAARYIQRRWDWFQTDGRLLAKKKKGRKGKKKKKK